MRTIRPPAWPSPYRLLGMVLLVAVVVAQLVGLVMLARSQVHKAELRAIAERSAKWEAANCLDKQLRSASMACGMRAATASEDGPMTAGYAAFR